jgi:hypothetical protein
MKRIDDLRALAARMAGAAGKRIAVSPESAEAVSTALRAYADQLSRPVEDHPNFTVDVWDDRDHVIETMARCSSLLVARAAYDQTLIERPSLKVTLRQGIRIVARREAPGASH